MIIGFAVSVGLVMLAFITSSAGFYAFASILCNAVSGALKLCLFEFMTEIIFPVSPVFGLGILNTISGLLSLVISMFSRDIVITNPLSNDFVYLVLMICLAIAAGSAFLFFQYPYKLNRTDYDTCRRQTMITTYSKKNGTKNNH